MSAWETEESVLDKRRSIDIFGLLQVKERKHLEEREQVLRSMGITEEYFEGELKIDYSTCDGIECRLCIETCPTKALYWSKGEVKLEEDLCIYCCACVLSCIVDNCIQVKRKRKDDGEENFGTPREIITTCKNVASRKRREIVKRKLLASISSYL